MQYDKSDVSLSRRRFSLWEIYNQIIDEALIIDPRQAKKLTPTSDGWKFDIQIKDEIIPVFIYIETASIDRFFVADKFKTAQEVVNFGFEMGEERDTNQKTKTDYKNYKTIFSTVGTALQELIQNKQPEIVTFFSDSKHGGHAADPQKDDIYLALLERNTISGYELGDIKEKQSSKKGIMLYKIKAFE